MHFIKLHLWISILCTVITMGQASNTWRNDINKAETSKTIMDELDRISSRAGAATESRVFSFIQQCSFVMLSSGAWWGLWELNHLMSPWLDYASWNPSPYASIKNIHTHIVTSRSEAAAGCLLTPGMLQLIQAIISLLSHLGMGKQQVLQPGLQLLLPWDLPLASLVLGRMLLDTEEGH